MKAQLEQASIFNVASSFNYFEIQKYHQNEPKFDVFIQDIIYLKDGAYIIDLDEYKSIGTHWIALYVNAKNETYFDSFGVEQIPKEIKKFIEIKILQRIFIEYKLIIQ